MALDPRHPVTIAHFVHIIRICELVAKPAIKGRYGLAGSATNSSLRIGASLTLTFDELKAEFIKRYGSGDVPLPPMEPSQEAEKRKPGPVPVLKPHRLMNFRMEEEDRQLLLKLVGVKGANQSEVIRTLIREAANGLGT